MSLTNQQIGFFKRHGYLIVPGAMDFELCNQVREQMWAQLPDEVNLQKDDADSHVGPFAAEDVDESTLHTRQGYRWLNRTLGVSDLVIRLIYSQSICGMAEQLLGRDLRQATVDGSPMGSKGPAWPGGPTDPAQGNEGARGVYCTLPYGDAPQVADQCHTDGHPFQLGVVGLIDDVPEDGGPFKVWPGSHERLYQTFKLRYDQPRVPYYDHLPSLRGIVHSEEYLQEIDQLNKEDAVPCWGKAGDIVFWHHRTAHMAGHNFSTTIRQAVLADFWSNRLDEFRLKSPLDDMWEDWSAALQNNDGSYSADLAKSQRLPV